MTTFTQFDMKYLIYSGDVAQLGERGVRNAEVEGSTPFISTMSSFGENTIKDKSDYETFVWSWTQDKRNKN